MRVGLAVIGGALVVRGLRKRSFGGLVSALVGGFLLMRALRGRGRASESRGRFAPSDETPDAVEVSRSIIVGKPADELYEMWRDPGEFSAVMGHFADVTTAGEDRLEWTVSGPGGRDFTWESRVVADEPGERLTWKTAPDATVPNEGTVRFRELDDDRGTEVTLSVTFDPPGGALGSAVLQRLSIAPEALAGEALSRFKSLAESGEIPTLDGNPSARGRGDVV